MPSLLRIVLAIVAGIAIGGAVNMALVTLSPALIPLPAGVDVNSAESLSKATHLLAAYLPMAWSAIQIGSRMKQGLDGARNKAF